jgi:hypothetical protein
MEMSTCQHVKKLTQPPTPQHQDRKCTGPETPTHATFPTSKKTKQATRPQMPRPPPPGLPDAPCRNSVAAGTARARLSEEKRPRRAGGKGAAGGRVCGVRVRKKRSRKEIDGRQRKVMMQSSNHHQQLLIVNVINSSSSIGLNSGFFQRLPHNPEDGPLPETSALAIRPTVNTNHVKPDPVRSRAAVMNRRT